MVERLFWTIYGPIYRQRQRLELFVIVIPMILLTLYYTLVATDRYYSETKVTVQRSGDIAGQIGGFSLPFLGALGSTTKEDALQLIEFIQSPELFEKLDARFALREELRINGLDVFNHVMPWAAQEDYLALYRKRVQTAFDDRNGVLTLRVQSNTAARAQAIAQAIIAEAEHFTNELSRHIAREQVAFATQELEHAKRKLDESRERLLAYQDKTGYVDPAASLEASNRIIAELQGQLSAKEVELKSLTAILQDDAPQLVALRQGIASLQSQIEAERKKLTSAQGSPMNRLAAGYQEQKALLDFHADVYKVSLAATEKLRIEAARKVKNLSVIAAPSLPDVAYYPRHAPATLFGWLLGLIVLYGLVRLAIEIIEDHRE